MKCDSFTECTFVILKNGLTHRIANFFLDLSCKDLKINLISYYTALSLPPTPIHSI